MAIGTASDAMIWSLTSGSDTSRICWTRLVPLLKARGPLSIPDNIVDSLNYLCLDRLALFLEVTSHLMDALTEEDSWPHGMVSQVQGVGCVLRHHLPAGERTHPLRYLPDGASPEAFSETDMGFSRRCRLSKPWGWSWLELLAAGGELSAAHIGACLEEAFLEGETLQQLDASFRAEERKRLFPFALRCESSGCSMLISAADISDKGDLKVPLKWKEGPRQRLSLTLDCLKSRKPLDVRVRRDSLRFPGHLLRERALRTEISSVAGSWRCTRAGLHAWDVFMREVIGDSEPHFPPSWERLSGFASFFINGDSLGKYISHIRLGCRLTRSIHLFPDKDLVSGLLRGARKFQPLKRMGALRQMDSMRLILYLIDAGELEVARLVVVARSFMTRTMDELLPAQLDGR